MAAQCAEAAHVNAGSSLRSFCLQSRTLASLGHGTDLVSCPQLPMRRQRRHAHLAVFTDITGPCLLRGPGRVPWCLRSASCQRKRTGEAV